MELTSEQLASARARVADPTGPLAWVMVAHELEGELARVAGDAEGEARALYLLSESAIEAGEFARARIRLDDRLAALEVAPTMLLPLLHLQRGTLARFESDWSGARRWFDRAETGIAANEALAQFLPVVHAERFSIDLELGQPGRAAAHIRAQLETARDWPSARHGAALNEVRLALFSERYTKCIRLARKALDAIEAERAELGASAHDLEVRLHVLSDRAKYASWTDVPERLVEIDKHLVEVLVEGDLPWEVQREIHFLRTLIALDREDRDTARTASERVLNAAPDSRDSAGRSPLPRCRLAALACLVAREANAPLEERREHLVGWNEAFDDFLRFWAETPIEPDGVGFLQLGMRRLTLAEGIATTLDVVGQDESRVVATERAFDLLLAAQAQGTLSRRWGVEVPTLADVRATLGTGTGLLAFLPGPRGSHLFLVDDERIEHVELAQESALVRALEDVNIGRPTGHRDESWVEPATRLSRLLLPADALVLLNAWSRVAVVGADLFGTLPMSWLPIEGTPLGLSKPLTTWPSVPLVVELAQRSSDAQPTRTALAVVAPELTPIQDQYFGPLAPVVFDNDDEERLREAYPDLRWTIRSGSKATPAFLEEGLATGVDLFFYLGHGVELPLELRPAALLLAPRADQEGTSKDEVKYHVGLVRSRDFERAFQNGSAPRVAILAACGTSRAPQRAGDEGVGHLGGALLASGTSTVVLSSAQLDRDATILWTARFHTHYGAGATVAQAALAANREVAADERFGHPFFFGRIRVLGL